MKGAMIMNTLKIFLTQLKEYKRAAVIASVFTALEVLLEVLIPFITASIIDKGIAAGDLGSVYFYGAVMLLMAVLSLICGICAGKYSASASTGLACNLRDGMYTNIQTFSFSNIDKYSTAGLVTRMTTDVTNVQNAAQMILRIALRCPLMLIFSMVMCFFINAQLSLIFLVAVIVLAVILFFIMSRTSRIFAQVL